MILLVMVLVTLRVPRLLPTAAASAAARLPPLLPLLAAATCPRVHRVLAPHTLVIVASNRERRCTEAAGAFAPVSATAGIAPVS